MSPIRTLHIANSLDKHTGGTLHAPLGISKYLERSGVSAEIAASYKPGDDLGYLKDAYPEVKTHAFARSFPARYANSSEFNRWFRQNLPAYDIVEIHSVFYAMAMHAAWECRRAGKPYLVRPHGSLDPFDLRKHAALKKVVGPLFIRPMLAGASAAVLTSDLEAQRMVSYGADVRRIVLPLPVPLSNTPADPGGFRRQHGIPADAVVVLFMSRIDPKKGLQLLIPAIARLQAEFERLWFVLAGTGDQQSSNSTEALLASQLRGVRTRKVGFLTGQAKFDALAAANVFALPSLNENFGIVLIEAMHAGLPLLISDEVYIHKEIHDHGACTVCQTSTESVAAALRRMLDGTIDLAAMGGRGRALVRSRYLPEAATEPLVGTYRDLLQRAPGS
jgi:glycosyltransferase involved in cell wall biosynthesis